MPPARGVRHPTKARPIDKTILIGKYTLSPLARRLPDDRYTASVSIRSGEGKASHDRVMRLTPLFPTRDDAIRFATDHGIAWLDRRDPATQPT